MGPFLNQLRRKSGFSAVIVVVLLVGCWIDVAAAAEATDATKTTVTVAGSGLESACAGVPAQFVITARDESGAARTSGGDNFIVELEGTRSISGSVLDNLDGTYTVTYTATKSGNYEASVMLATSGGLSASYYENVWFFYTPVKQTVDPQINFNWGTGLITATGADYISIRWVGKVKTQYAEVYTFFASTDDGARLWVDNVPLIDRWDSFCNETSATISLKANVFYNIKMEYKEVTGTAYAFLSWSSQSTPKGIIPSSQLYYETQIQQSPFSVVVSPHLACGPRSTASGTGLAIATAGTAAQLTIQANDPYDNGRGVGGDLFSVRIFPPATSASQQPAHATVVDNSDSSYSVEYTAYTAGVNTLKVSLMQTSGVLATYYSDNFVTAVTTTSTTDAAWRDISFTNTAGPSGMALPFRARWVGFIKPTMDDSFTFHAKFSTNERVKLWVDNSLLVNQWDTLTATDATGVIQLRSNFFYDLKVEFSSFAGPGTTSLSLLWVGSSGSLTQVADSFLYAGYDVMSSPFLVNVMPAGTCAARTTATDSLGSLSIATAGVQSQFTITARDLYGNNRNTGGETFKVLLTGADSNSGLVQDRGDGSYQVFYTPTKSGNYDISIVYGASGIAGSPYRLIVMPGKRHIPSSVATSLYLTLTTAGVPAMVTITIKDALGNLQPAADWAVGSTSANLKFSLATGESITSTPPDCTIVGRCPDGITSAKLVMSYTAFISGSFSLLCQATTLNDGAVMGSPFPLTVFPNLPCATTSTAYGSALSLATAGTTAAFVVSARDMFGNSRGTHVGDRFTGTINQFPLLAGNGDDKRNKIAAATDHGDSTYPMTYVATRATVNTLWATLAAQGGLQSTYYIANTPSGVYFDPNPVSWTSTTGNYPSLVVNSNFNTRWTGLVRPPYAGVYTFTATTPAVGQALNVYVDNKQIIAVATTATTGSGSIGFASANTYYDLYLDYQCVTPATQGFTLQWTSASVTTATVPSDRIFGSFHISGSPFSVNVQPAIACSTTSTIGQTAISLATAGTTATFSVQSKDAFGNNRIIAGDPWDFALLSSSLLLTNLASQNDEPSVNDGGSLSYQATSTYLSNGQYVVSYTGTKQGIYQLRGKLRQAGGLYGTYFENSDLTDNGQIVGGSTDSTALPFRRLDPTINFSWGTGKPVQPSEMSTQKSIGPDFFGVRWYGMVMPPYSETWTFTAQADDSVKLWVNGLLVINQWSTQNAASAVASTQSYSRCSSVDGTIALMKDTLYTIQLDYKEIMGNATIILWWSSHSQAKQVVPSERLFVETTSKSLSRSGYSLTIYPAVTCASQSSATGPGLTIATVGSMSSFIITSRDQFGNPRRLGDFPIFHAKVTPVIEGQQLPLAPSAVTRLSGGDYPGGLSATYYHDNIMVVTCDTETWSTEPGQNPRCGLGPWSGTDYSFASGGFPAFLGPAAPSPYSVRWVGYVKPSAAAQYTFTVTTAANSFARLTVNGVSTPTNSGAQSLVVTFPTAEQLYDISATYTINALGQNNFMSLTWGIGGSSAYVPSDRLFPLAGRYEVDYTPTIKGDYSVHVGLALPGGLDATYYDDQDLTSARYSRIDGMINLDISKEADFSTGARTTDVALSDIQSFGVRWSGLLKSGLTSDTTFTFYVFVPFSPANGERVRLWVDNSLVIDRWETYDQISATVFTGTMVVRGSATQQLYTEIKMEYKQYAGNQGMAHLEWAAATVPQATVPSTNLFYMRHIAGSPFPPSHIYPAPTCASVSTARGSSLSASVSGVNGTFTIQTYDAYGNERGVGGDAIFARLFPVSGSCTGCPVVYGSVVDNSDSSYSATYNATKIGQYNVISSLTAVGGLSATYYSSAAAYNTPLYRSSAAVPNFATYPVPASVVSAQALRARFQGFIQPTTSGAYTFTMVTGNAANEGLQLWIENNLIYNDWSSLASTAETASYSFATANNYYDLTLDYKQTIAGGPFTLNLQWKAPGVATPVSVVTTRMWKRDDIANGVVPSLTVIASATAAAASIATGNGLSTATAGIPATATITCMDSFANQRSLDEDSFFVRLQKNGVTLNNVLTTYVGSSPGTYSVQYTATVSGLYDVAVALPSVGGLLGQYYNNMWLLGDPADTNIDSTVNFNWGTGPVTPRSTNITTGSDYVSVRWSGFFKPSLAEVYTFHTVTDDGVRLWVDNSLLIDQWDASGLNFTASFTVTPGLLYDVKMEYKEVTNTAWAQLMYSTQSIARRVIPSSRLFYNAQHVFGSPFRLYVDPAATCATTSTLTGLGISFTTAGIRSMFTIQAKDQFSNTKTQWDTTTDFFAVRATPTAAIGSYTASLMAGIKRATIANNVVKGKYTVSYTPTMAGSTSLFATLGMQGGLTATYYKLTGATADFSLRYQTAIEKIDFSNNLANDAHCPQPTCSAYYATRWEGFYQAPVTTDVTFQFVVHDNSERVRMWVDNSLLIDQWSSLGGTAITKVMDFPVANALYDIKVEYVEYNVGGSAVNQAQLNHAYTGVANAVVSTSRLFQIGPGVSRSPWPLTVQPDVTSHAKSVIYGQSLTLATAGLLHQFTIASKDLSANSRTSGGNMYLVHAAQDPTLTANGAVFDGLSTDLGDGQYLVRYTPTEQGAYNLHVYLGSQEQMFSLFVYPGAGCATQSRTAGNALSIATAGVMATFTIISKDQYKNFRTVGTNEFVTRLSNGYELHNRPAIYAGQGQPLGNLGKFTVQYRTTQSGNFSLSVRMLGQSGLSAVFYRDTVLGNAVYAETHQLVSPACCSWNNNPPNDAVGIPDGFSVRWTGFVKSIAASTYTFQTLVNGLDERVRLWVNDRWVINSWSSLGATTVSGTIGLLGNTLYDLKMEYKDVTGGASIGLMWSGSGSLDYIQSSNLFTSDAHVSGSPFTITVYPGVTCGALSTAFGAGLSLATSGIASAFTIQAKDNLGNTVSSSSDVFVVRARYTTDYTLRDLHGTVTSLAGNNGQYQVSYVANRKEGPVGPNSGSTLGGPYHDVITSLALTSYSLFATFYDDITQNSGKTVVTSDLSFNTALANLNTNYGVTAPGTKFGARWLGFISPPYGGSAQYTFSVTTNGNACENVRLYVDNQLIIDKWSTTPAATENSATVMQFAVANGLYDLQLEYRGTTCGVANAMAQVTWTSPIVGSGVAIPTSRIFQRYDIALNTYIAGGLAATYFQDETLTGNVDRWGVDQTVDWSGPGLVTVTRPFPNSQADTLFSVRWYGFVQPSRWDLYTFYVQVASSNERVQLWIDNSLVVNQWSSYTSAEASGTYWFSKANDYYPIQLYYKCTQAASASLMYRLKWENTGNWLSAKGITAAVSDQVTKGVIPSSRLFQRLAGSTVARNDQASWFSTSYQCAWCQCTTDANCLSTCPQAYECRGKGYLGNDPAKVYLRPAASCATTTTANGNALTLVTVGALGTFRVSVRDFFGNMRDSSNDALMGRSTEPVSGSLFFTTFASNPSAGTLRDPLGWYTGTYLITRSGSYQFDVSLTDGNGNGLYGSYFQNNDLTGQVVNKIDSIVDFNWGSGAPTAETVIGADNFSVRWTGYVRPSYSEVYTFFVRSDDGCRLWIKGTSVIDAWTTTGLENQGTVLLSSNVQYDLKLEYLEYTGNAYVELWWQSPSQAKAVIPSTNLYPAKRTIGGGLNTLTVREGVVSATVSTLMGATLTLVTAGIAGTFTIQAKDRYGNLRTNENPFASEYQGYVRVIPDDAASNAASRTVKGSITAGTASTGQHLGSITVTRAGTHNLYSSVVIGTWPAPSAYGLMATYYDEMAFTAPAFSRVDSTLDWSTSGNVAPASAADDGIFSVRWSGLLLSVATAGYTFKVELNSANERVRLWFDNYLVIDQWSSLANVIATGLVTRASLTGLFYDIQLDYRSMTADGSGSQVKLKWQNDVNAEQVIPSGNLFQAFTVTGQPTRVKVNPAIACATTSIVRGAGLSLTTVGTMASFTVTVRDSFTNVRGVGGDYVLQRLFPQGYAAGMPHNPALAAGTCVGCPSIVRGATSDNGDATYKAAYTPTKKGSYTLTTSLLVQGGLSATYWDSLASVDAAITAGASGAAAITTTSQTVDFSYAIGSWPTGMTDENYMARWVGVVRPSLASLYTFFVGINNANERVRLWVDNSVVIDQWTSLTVAAEVSGTYSFGAVNDFYDLTLAYRHDLTAQASKVSLKWQNTATGVTANDVSKSVIPSTRLFMRYDISANSIYSNPAVGCASTSTAYLAATSLATAGASAAFTILGKDAYSNNRDSNTDMAMQVDLYGSGGAPVLAASVTTGAANAYTATYTATNAKNYELFVKYNNDNAMGSPFTLTVLPNVICGTLSTASGTGLSASASGSTSALTIQARDAWSNAKTQNGEGYTNDFTFVVRVVRTNAGQGPSPETAHVDRAATTIHGLLGTLANDGKYPFTWVQDTSTGLSHYLFASWAIKGGLMATYYSAPYASVSGTTFDTSVATYRKSVGVSQTVNTASLAAPNSLSLNAASIPTTDSRAIRWSGFIRPSLATTYNFAVSHLNSGIRLFIDNNLIIDAWTPMVASATNARTFAFATANDYYDITLEYQQVSNALGSDGYVFQYDPTGGTTYTVWPSDRFFMRQDITGSPWNVIASSS